MEKPAAQGLDRLLRPRSIVAIGGREAEKCVRESLAVGFDGAIYPVSRSRDSMAGIPAYRSLADLPAVPDAAYIAIPPDATIEAVRELSEMGVGGAVVYASGFSEVGQVGVERQARLIEAAGGMGLMGPNCYGIINYLDGVALWPDDHGGRRVDRGVGIVSQSGNVTISLSMQARGLPVGFIGSLGNQAKDGVPQVMASLLRDDRITAIGVFLEGLADVDGFRAAACAAAEKGIPVVVLKTGESEAAARVALSHTSSMTGSSAAFSALCESLAVVEARSLSDFLELLKFLHVYPGLPGSRLMTMSCSGGEAGLLADGAARRGIPMPPFPEDRIAALNTVLGDRVAVDNPLDYHTYIWGDRDAMTACFTEALRHPSIDVGLLALDTADRDDLDFFGWPEAQDAICAAARESDTPTIVASSLEENMPPALQDRFLSAGIAPMHGFDAALTAVDRAAWYYAARDRVRARTRAAIFPAPRTGAPVTLDEWRSKRALASFGMPVPDGALVSTPTEAVAAAEAIGYPVVVKACGANLAHKTEAGGVALNLIDADAVHSAAERMLGLTNRAIVEAMAQAPVCELIVGVSRDPQFGLLLMVGAGGILAEVMKDAVLLALPAGRDEIDAALGRLKVAPVLAGYRGRPAADRTALLDAIEAVARFAEAHSDRLLELDVNPVIAGRDGVVAADALVRWVEE